MSEKRDFKGIWIPKEIWLSKNLSIMEKLFLVEIDSLDNEDHCYANNKYFAGFFDLGITRVSQIINGLIKKNYIHAEYVREGKRAVQRVLTIKCKNLLHKSVRTPLEKCKDINTIKNTINTVGGTDSKKSHQLVISTFYDLYQQRYNSKPTIDSATGKSVKDLLKKQDVDTIISRLHLYFEKEHYFTKGGRDFKNFRYNFDKLATTIDKDLEEAMKEAEVC